MSCHSPAVDVTHSSISIHGAYCPKHRIPTFNISPDSFAICSQPSTNTPLDVCKVEGLIPTLYGADATEILGARSLCTSLSATNPPVPWAIVTSGTSPLANGWLRILKLPTPAHFVTAESVANGKPDPQGYLMGAESLKLDPKGLLVLEDSPAGIKAGKAAGCRVLGVATTHTAKEVKEAGADWVVEDLRSVVVARVGEEGGVVLKISNGWVGN